MLPLKIIVQFLEAVSCRGSNKKTATEKQLILPSSVGRWTHTVGYSNFSAECTLEEGNKSDKSNNELILKKKEEKKLGNKVPLQSVTHPLLLKG